MRIDVLLHGLDPTEIKIQVSHELATALHCAPEELACDLRLRALAGLVERGLISWGRVAELGGISQREFLDWCGRWHIRVHRSDATDLSADLEFSGVERSR